MLGLLAKNKISADDYYADDNYYYDYKGYFVFKYFAKHGN
jgi:hypothetical protein